MKKIFKNIADKIKKPFMSIDNPDQVDTLLIIVTLLLIGSIIYTIFTLGEHG